MIIYQGCDRGVAQSQTPPQLPHHRNCCHCHIIFQMWCWKFSCVYLVFISYECYVWKAWVISFMLDCHNFLNNLDIFNLQKRKWSWDWIGSFYNTHGYQKLKLKLIYCLNHIHQRQVNVAKCSLCQTDMPFVVSNLFIF